MTLIVSEMKGAMQTVWKLRKKSKLVQLHSPPPPFLIITWFIFKNNFSIADFQVYANVLSALGYMWMHSVC